MNARKLEKISHATRRQLRHGCKSDKTRVAADNSTNSSTINNRDATNKRAIIKNNIEHRNTIRHISLQST